MQLPYDDGERARAVAERTREFVSEVLVDVERDLRSATELPCDRLADLHDREVHTRVRNAVRITTTEAAVG